MMILALSFIAMIGVLLVLDSLGFKTGPEYEILEMPIEKVMVYFSMLIAVAIEVIQLRHKANLERLEVARNRRAAQPIEAEDASGEAPASAENDQPPTPRE